MTNKDQFPFGQDYDWNAKVFLGEGSYGKVYKVKNLKDGKFYAIKSMDMQEFNKDPNLMKALKGEIAITQDVKSEYTVEFVNFKIGQRFTYIILQLCDYDLRKELATKKLTEPQCVQAFDQIMSGFKVLVDKGYIHRDVKPANVLVSNQIHKVADFGFACKADILGKKKLSDICGTPLYMAPQLLKNQPYTAKSDIWSLGLMFYEMIFGYTPWPCRSIEEYLKNITTQPLKFPFDGKIGNNTKDFIEKSLVVDENKRISWKQVFDHPLIKHSNTGNEAPKVNINDYVKTILLRIQENISKRSINVLGVVNKYKNAQINLNNLSSLLKDIDPTITSHEIETLFGFLDQQKSGSIPWKTIEEKILNVDFREQNDVLSRKLDQVAAIIKELKLNPQTLFDKIDVNHSNSIDFNEFAAFMASIAPKYTNNEIVQIFKLLDTDRDEKISTQQFKTGIVSKLPTEGLNIPTARAKRNIETLVNYMREKKVTAEELIKMGDADKQKGLSLKQFQTLLNTKLKFKISKEEVGEIFLLIDVSHNELVTFEEIASLLKK